jgi:molybdenum cofactor biosynthesis protein B
MTTVTEGPTPRPLELCILTVSDTRTLETDRSGKLLVDFAEQAGHHVVQRKLLPDDLAGIRSQVSAWAEDASVEVILLTGGTGVTGRDVSCEAVEPLLDKRIDGFGELFRMLSYEQIGAATIQSRAFAGLARGTLVFALPGSSGAVALAVEKILWPQFDIRTKPCNFAQLIPRFKEV